MNLKILNRLTLLFLIGLILTNAVIIKADSPTPLLNLNYLVKIDTTNVEIDLEIENPVIKNHSPYLVFYIGNIRLNALQVISEAGQNKIPFQIQGQMLLIGPLTGFEKKLIVHYVIRPGSLAKHGHQGYLHQNFCILGGEQFLILPAAGRAARTQIQFEFPEIWEAFLPLIQAPQFQVSHHQLITTDTSWSGFYQLVKTCYIFGKFSASPDPNRALNFVFSMEMSDSVQKMIKNLVIEMIHFFDYRFQQYLSRYTFCFISFADDSEKIMSGVGSFSMGFTFLPNEKRDWQLLAHRLFHVYFDRFMNIKSLHLLPDIWFLEGLATFYEILAPGKLNLQAFGIKSYTPDEEFSRLYQKYLYFRVKDPELFQLIPVEKTHLLSGQTEFLHYTQAPLIILAIHTLLTPDNSPISNDIFRDWLEKLKFHPDTTLEASFNEIADSSTKLFWQNFIAGDSLLNLCSILSKSSEKKFPAQSQEIMHELKEYEYLLSTWFQNAPDKFLKESLFENEFQALIHESNQRKIHFGDPTIENTIFDFSPTVFYLLKIHWLRMHVCKIEPTDPARNFKLVQLENLEIWNNFIAKLKISK